MGFKSEFSRNMLARGGREQGICSYMYMYGGGLEAIQKNINDSFLGISNEFLIIVLLNTLNAFHSKPYILS